MKTCHDSYHSCRIMLMMMLMLMMLLVVTMLLVLLMAVMMIVMIVMSSWEAVIMWLSPRVSSLFTWLQSVDLKLGCRTGPGCKKTRRKRIAGQRLGASVAETSAP